MITKKTIQNISDDKSMRKKDDEKRYHPIPKKREEERKYYPKPGKEHQSQPNYSPDQNVREKGKDYRDFREEGKLAYATEPTKMKIGSYNVEIRLPLESTDWVWEKGRLQVNVTSDEGKEYYADFVTLKYIKEVLDKKFPELGNGNYFLGKDKIIIKDLDENTVRNTLEDLILNWKDSLEEFFERR